MDSYARSTAGYSGHAERKGRTVCVVLFESGEEDHSPFDDAQELNERLSQEFDFEIARRSAKRAGRKCELTAFRFESEEDAIEAAGEIDGRLQDMGYVNGGEDGDQA